MPRAGESREVTRTWRALPFRDKAAREHNDEVYFELLGLSEVELE